MKNMSPRWGEALPLADVRGIVLQACIDLPKHPMPKGVREWSAEFLLRIADDLVEEAIDNGGHRPVDLNREFDLRAPTLSAYSDPAVSGMGQAVIGLSGRCLDRAFADHYPQAS